MEFRELTGDELAAMAAERRKDTVYGIVSLFMFAGLAVFAFLYYRKGWYKYTVAFAFGLAGALAGAIVLFSAGAKIAADMREGRACIVRGIAAEKHRTKEGKCSVVIDGVWYGVGENAYRRIETGETIEVDFGPRSRFVVGVKNSGGEVL